MQNTSIIRTGATAAVVLALAGCAGLPGLPGAAPGGGAARCDAAAAQFAIGQSFAPSLERELRERSGASIVRWLSPGQAVTMEHNPGRLNLTLDARSRVTRVGCG